MSFIYPLTYLTLLIAGTFFFVASLIFIRKKPIIIKSSMVFRIFINELLLSYLISIYEHPSVIDHLFILFFTIPIAISLTYLTKNILIYGATAHDINSEIIKYLKCNNIEFDTVQNDIFLINPNLRLIISSNEKYAFTKIQFKGKGYSYHSDKIIQMIKQEHLKVNLSYCTLALLIGSLFAFTFLVLYYLNFN